MSKGKRGTRARMNQPKFGKDNGKDSFADKIKVYKWSGPCKHCKRLGLHDPDCPKYVWHTKT